MKDRSSILHVKCRQGSGRLQGDCRALYVTREMLLEKVNEVSMENRMVERETEFMWHTIFQGLGERSRPMIRVDQHVITTRVGNNKSRSAEKTRLRVVPTRR